MATSNSKNMSNGNNTVREPLDRHDLFFGSNEQNRAATVRKRLIRNRKIGGVHPLAAALMGRRWLGLSLFLFVGACSTPPPSNSGDGDTVDGDGSNGANEAPAIELLEPTDDLLVNAGDAFNVRWSDSDADSNADISVFMVPANGGGNPQLMGTVKENDDGADAGPDALVVETDELEPGDFNLLVVIDDGVNQVTSVFATDLGGALLTVTIGE